MRAQYPPAVGAESRPFSWSNVDLPWGMGRGVGYGGGGGGGGITPEQQGTYQGNFLNALRSGRFYWPNQISGFGPSGWWYRQDYEQPANIEPSSWLWRLPEEYRGIYESTTPEIQAAIAGTLWPEYQRRQQYQGWPGTTRMMR